MQLTLNGDRNSHETATVALELACRDWYQAFHGSVCAWRSDGSPFLDMSFFLGLDVPSSLASVEAEDTSAVALVEKKLPTRW